MFGHNSLSLFSAVQEDDGEGGAGKGETGQFPFPPPPWTKGEREGWTWGTDKTDNGTSPLSSRRFFTTSVHSPPSHTLGALPTSQGPKTVL